MVDHTDAADERPEQVPGRIGPGAVREPVTSAANGHRTADPAAAVAGARPVVLLRYRPGIIGRTARVVHLVPLPAGHQAGTAGVAFCGALLRRDLVETVRPGQGMSCRTCNARAAGRSSTPRRSWR